MNQWGGDKKGGGEKKSLGGLKKKRVSEGRRTAGKGVFVRQHATIQERLLKKKVGAETMNKR